MKNVTFGDSNYIGQGALPSIMLLIQLIFASNFIA